MFAHCSKFISKHKNIFEIFILLLALPIISYLLMFLYRLGIDLGKILRNIYGFFIKIAK